MSLRAKLHDVLGEIELPEDRKGTANRLLEVICENLDRSETSVKEIEKELLEVLNSALNEAEKTVARAEEVTP